MKIELDLDIGAYLKDATEELSAAVIESAKYALQHATEKAVAEATERYYKSGPGKKALDKAVAKAYAKAVLHV